MPSASDWDSSLEFEWNPDKSAANLKKHGVSFRFATRVWDDDSYILREDREDESGEMRWHAIGLVDDVLLLVVHAYRSKRHGKEIIRIISARKASRGESTAYFQ